MNHVGTTMALHLNDSVRDRHQGAMIAIVGKDADLSHRLGGVIETGTAIRVDKIETEMKTRVLLSHRCYLGS